MTRIEAEMVEAANQIKVTKSRDTWTTWEQALVAAADALTA